VYHAVVFLYIFINCFLVMFYVDLYGCVILRLVE